ncbi:hypothetical protein KR093_006353 [Drosophila rubida]|uniref:Venom serine protease n=1 Tax=Drosophila rubida TaxID=30044 RepID=A0AAD4JRW9_9MUSC|nr:hypothetical protein KR093_006353 [Drosophila rubida]
MLRHHQLLLLLNGCLLALPAAWGYFEGCDNSYTLGVGTTYVESPYYPENYPAKTSCRYKFTAPLDHYITAKCTVNLPSNNGQCSTDNFWLDTEGDLLMRTSENFCGSGTFSRDSLFTELVFAYISTGSSSGKFSCALTVQPQSCNCGWSATTRITNGQAAGANEFPSMVALKDRTSNAPILCGGVIVSHRHVVTAAHCTLQVSQATNLVAIVGINSLQNPSNSIYYDQYSIQQMLRHEQYVNNPNVANDIAVLTTASNIKWSRGVGPICLPPLGTTNTFSYDTVDVIGFGMTSFGGALSSTLQKINLMVVSNVDCQTDYNGVATIDANQMCTYDYSSSYRDSCQFDSGGPVIRRSTKHFLVGVVSFGKNCGSTANSMGVNTRVTSYVSWIRQKIGYSNCVVAM